MVRNISLFVIWFFVSYSREIIDNDEYERKAHKYGGLRIRNLNITLGVI